jgi:ADP-ribose pyrophosphatase YjhB (NUDIX family)
MTLGVRAAVFDARGRVFLVRHTYLFGWHLSGGGVEAGQTLLQALTRELEEEACLKPLGTPLLHGVFFNRAASRWDHVAVFVVRDFIRLGEKQPDHEITETGFFSLDALPDSTTPGTRIRLAEMLDGAQLSAFWS